MAYPFFVLICEVLPYSFGGYVLNSSEIFWEKFRTAQFERNLCSLSRGYGEVQENEICLQIEMISRISTFGRGVEVFLLTLAWSDRSSFQILHW
jgi:hypothetical protein